jgi:hypothetical protein
MEASQLEKNVDAMIADALQGNGVLNGPAGVIFAAKDAELRHQNEDKKKRGLAGVVEEEQLKLDVEAAYKKAVLGSGNKDDANDKSLKTFVTKVSKGEMASFDVKEIPGLVSAATQTWSAFQTLNPLNIIPAVLSLVSNSIVGDWVKGVVMSFSDREKYPSVGDAMQQVKLERSVTSAAEQLKVDKDELLAALTKTENKPVPVTQKPAEPANPASTVSALVERGSERVLAAADIKTHDGRLLGKPGTPVVESLPQGPTLA